MAVIASCRSARCSPRSGWSALVHAEHPVSLSRRSGCCSALATAASLYDPAFATLGRIFGTGARAPITVLTLAGGFASTVSWPVTHVLLDAVGWRGTYLIYAAVLALVAAPLHAFALPRRRADLDARPDRGRGAAGRGAAAARLALRPGGGGVRRLCLRAVRAFGASARDLRPRRHRRRRRGHDRRPVRPVAGPGPHRRAHVRAPHPSADGRALRGRHAARGLRAAGARSACR